ncbi:MAG: glycosyltransferase [Turneriella sp.]|nr:glycosyltransferase [Turneriella sp.]
MPRKPAPPDYKIIILSRGGWHNLRELIPQLLDCAVPPSRILVKIAPPDVREKEFLQKHKIAAVAVPDSEFDHGLTREKLRRRAHSRFAVFLTEDVRVAAKDFLEKLLAPLREKKAALSYARQLPHADANFWARFARAFNYPEKSELRTPHDLARWGAPAYFCSNSCAAWDNRALDSIGGFRRVLTGEDADAAARLLLAGFCIAYVAESLVFHSHNYTLIQEFRRYFDTGYARAALRHSEPLSVDDSSRGNAFARKLLLETLKQRPWLLPYAILHLASKWLGYQLGSYGRFLPVWLCRFLSAQKHYWRATT